LRHFGAENQDDWDKLLVFAEFAYNYSKHSSTGFTPFRLYCGFDPALPTSFQCLRISILLLPSKKGSKCPGVDEFFKRIQQAIVVAQQQQKYYADLKRRPDDVFDVDVKVLLCTKNLHIRKGGSKKLLPRYIGPLNITEQINPVAFKLDLPNRLRMHNVSCQSLKSLH
jgi:hypothetical protein